MEWLAEKDDTIFLGQAVNYSGNAMFNTTKTISSDKKIELPVFEDVQMGMSLGMAYEGVVPITSYPRFDFLLLALNQMINHLDKFPIITQNIYFPKAIKLIFNFSGIDKKISSGKYKIDNSDTLVDIFYKIY